MEIIQKQLEEANVGRVITNEPLSRHTTMKIGGPAELFIEPSSIEGLKKTIEIVKANGIKWRVIGRGSNLLVPDSGMKGVVIKLGNGLDHLKINDDEIRVGAGYSLIKLATIMSNKEELSGLEFAGGIPGSVGGAVYMNAGAHGSDISKILQKAHILFPDGNMEWLSVEAMKYSYRTSILQKEMPGICVEAVFQLKRGDRETISGQLQKHKDYRRETQPWNYPCAGSIFRNPLPQYAGQLIEESGLKGHQIGGAQISELHANFIVNKDDATAKDVLSLIEHIKETIHNNYQVSLETEIEIIKES